MKKSTLEHIKLLTSLDTKTLNERVVKLFEEGGELARVVAPYENVSSTRHRMVDRKKILEEAVDCLLVAYSIAHHVDFTDDEIEEMFHQKLLKWNSRLAKEEKTRNKPIPYEIHVTVKVETSEIERFKLVCKEHDVKPIILALQDNQMSTVMQDVMTSSVHIGNNTSALQAAQDLARHLTSREFPIMRIKIETVPWHPAAPQNNGDVMPANCYFESHLGLTVTADQLEDVRNTAKIFGAHLSKNPFKVLDNGMFVQMLTLRSYIDPYPVFERRVQDLKYALTGRVEAIDKEIVEFSVYDTRVSHDVSWISSS